MPKKIPDKLEGFAALIGLTFTKLEKGHSQCTLEVQDKLLNPHRTLHGGAIFTMADSGMGATLYSCIDDDELCSTIGTNIVYFKAAKSGSLTCDTKVIHISKTIAALESEIRQGGNLVAKAFGTWSIYKEKRD
jgi:acyl-CoA thioesterase